MEDLTGKMLNVDLKTTSDTPKQAPQVKAQDTTPKQMVQPENKQPQKIFNSMTYKPKSND